MQQTCSLPVEKSVLDSTRRRGRERYGVIRVERSYAEMTLGGDVELESDWHQLPAYHICLGLDAERSTMYSCLPRQAAAMNATEFDQKFDAGGSIANPLDFEKARRAGLDSSAVKAGGRATQADGVETLATELLAARQVLADAAAKAARRIVETHAGRLEACGYELARFYTVLERMLESICEAFESRFERRGDWQEKLLTRLSLELSGLRPAFLPEGALSELRL